MKRPESNSIKLPGSGDEPFPVAGLAYIAFYQIGYGIGAFGVGPLQSWAGLDLNVIFGATALVALLMSALSFAVVWSPADRIPLTVTKEEIL